MPWMAALKWPRTGERALLWRARIFQWFEEQKWFVTYLISRLIDNCALRYIWPINSPRIVTMIPGSKNIGLNSTMLDKVQRTPKTWSATHISSCGMSPSTARISWVHLVMIRAVGVSSNQLTIDTGYDKQRERLSFYSHSPQGASKDRLHKCCVNDPRCTNCSVTVPEIEA